MFSRSNWTYLVFLYFIWFWWIDELVFRISICSLNWVISLVLTLIWEDEVTASSFNYFTYFSFIVTFYFKYSSTLTFPFFALSTSDCNWMISALSSRMTSSFSVFWRKLYSNFYFKLKLELWLCLRFRLSCFKLYVCERSSLIKISCCSRTSSYSLNLAFKQSS